MAWAEVGWGGVGRGWGGVRWGGRVQLYGRSVGGG